MPEVFGQESWFNEDAKFFKDVYVYGTLYYDFDGLGDNLRVDDLIVNGQANIKDLYVTGLSTFAGNVSFTNGITTFQKDVKINGTLDAENIDVGIATVRERFELTNDGGTNYLTGFVTGARAGRVGIGSELPQQLLDVAGSVKISQNIFDSANFSGGNSGYYLSRDVNGIRWVYVPPESLSEGFFVQNEGVQVGVGSFTTLNLIGNGSGGDLVNATVNSVDNRIVDISIIDHWTKNISGIHTTVNVGINVVSPQHTLDVDGFSLFRDQIGVSGLATFSQATFSDSVIIDSTLRVTDLITGTATTSRFANQSGFSTVSGIATFANQAGFATASGIATFSTISGISTFAIQAGFATASGIATFSTISGISTFANQAGFATVSGISTFAIQSGFSTVSGISTFAIQAGFATVSGISTFAIQSGFSTVSGISTFAIQAGFATASGIATFSTISGIATFANQAGFATVSGISTFAIQAGFATVSGIATFAIQSGFSTVSGISTFAIQSGFSTVSGISTFAIQAGFATVSGIATFANQAGFATVSGFATNAARAGIATFIETVQTLTNQDFFIPFVEHSTSTGIETVRVDSGIKYNPSTDTVTVGGGLTVGGALTAHNGLKVYGNSVFDDSVELNSTLIDINGSVAFGKTDYRLASVGTGVSWRPAGVETKNILYVTKDGNDSNSGLLEGDAKATIGGAAAVALDGDTIYVRPGTYFENNPIGLRTDVSISGQDLRLVTVVPNNPSEDLFHVRRGCLIENMNFAGNDVNTSYTGAMVAFPPLVANQNSGYVAAGPANEGPSGRWRSPYIRNCTNFATDSIGLKIDGNLANAAYSGTNNLGQDLKSIVVDSYTQYNQNGIGVSITNKGYAQLVSIFTINPKIAIFTASGGQCDLTNSNSSFGIFGLYADGTSGDEFTGITTGANIADNDTYQVFGVRDENSNVRKPFDGQGAFFKINLDDYPDTGSKSGIVTEPLRIIRSIKVTNGGSGYSETAPPTATVSQPFGPEGILAELSANVSAAGTISSVDIIASGRNFLPAGSGSNQQDIAITFSGSGGATAEAITDPILFTINTATEPTANTGLTTVTFDQFVPYDVGTGVSMSFRRLSRIITSSHSFEYVGAGTDINRANPFQGGVPIPDNEVVAINGGQVPFTSTDQKGNFKIGSGLVIDQTTATISGRDFNRAIQANLTPLILALGG